MRKTIVMFAAGFALFSLTTACNDSQQNKEEPVDSVENTTENATDATSENVQDSSKELENTDIVPSGTYTGTAKVVDDQQKEVYVQLEDNKTIELYFSNDTEIMRNGESVSFDALEQGQKLEVEVVKNGDHLNPQRVTILE